MYLVLCTKCKKLVQLDKELRSCQCEKSSGYMGEDIAHYSGDEAIVLKIDEKDLTRAICESHDDFEQFKAYVVGHHNPFIREF